MAYNITFQHTALKDLIDIDKKQAARIVLAIADKLSRFPDQYPFLKGKFKNFRKFRVGDYRVLFRIQDQNIQIYYIRHRSVIYD